MKKIYKKFCAEFKDPDNILLVYAFAFSGIALFSVSLTLFFDYLPDEFIYFGAFSMFWALVMILTDEFSRRTSR